LILLVCKECCSKVKDFLRELGVNFSEEAGNDSSFKDSSFKTCSVCPYRTNVYYFLYINIGERFRVYFHSLDHFKKYVTMKVLRERSY